MPVSLLGAGEIRALAADLDVTPTKKLGQNFVVDANTVRKIVTASGVGRDDTVIEVGPGLGSLTLPLLDAAGRVVAGSGLPVGCRGGGGVGSGGRHAEHSTDRRGPDPSGAPPAGPGRGRGAGPDSGWGAGPDGGWGGRWEGPRGIGARGKSSDPEKARHASREWCAESSGRGRGTRRLSERRAPGFPTPTSPPHGA